MPKKKPPARRQSTPTPAGSSDPVQWETLRQAGGAAVPKLQRTRLPGGWIVSGGLEPHIIFVPDPDHTWLEPDDPPEWTIPPPA
jgi:hypothetical protein